MSEVKNARNEIAAFKAYRNKLKDPAKAVSNRSYMITKKELDNIVNQLSGVVDDNKAIRIYFGAKNIDNEMVPTMHIVACEILSKETNGDPDESMDYKIPVTEADLAIAETSGNLPVMAKTYPCPPRCPKTNVFTI